MAQNFDLLSLNLMPSWVTVYNVHNMEIDKQELLTLIKQLNVTRRILIEVFVDFGVHA